MPILNVRIFTPSDIVKYYVEQPDVKVIYIRPTGEWRYHSSQQITSLRKNMLEPLLNYSSKSAAKVILIITPAGRQMCQKTACGWYRTVGQ